MRHGSARFLTIGSVLLLLIGAAAFAISGRKPELDVSPRANKPALMLLTTLPIMFPEEFSLENSGSKVLTKLETRYRIVPLGTTDGASLRQAHILLLAHPLAQPAQSLVDLDRWVRNGGRVLLLADPRLDWPSKRPLGDKLRPPPAFADTGLLEHWGLELTQSEIDGPVSAEVGPNFVVFSSPGELRDLQAACDLEAKGIVARCRVGHGKITVVADADWLNVDDLSKEEGQDEQLSLLLRELARLER
jgi:hypothetical protein